MPRRESQSGYPIFEIAIYRKSPGELEKDLNSAFEKKIQRADPYSPRTNSDHQNPAFQFLKDKFWKEHGEPYPYNQVIGWVVLFARRDQILIKCYKVNAKSLTRYCRRHPFEPVMCFSIPLGGNETAKEIVALIVEELRVLPTERPFKNGYVDTKAFMRLAPYINWKRLIRESG